MRCASRFARCSPYLLPPFLLVLSIVINVYSRFNPTPSLFFPPFPAPPPLIYKPSFDFDLRAISPAPILLTGVMQFLRVTLQPDIYRKAMPPGRPLYPKMMRRYVGLTLLQAVSLGPPVIENAAGVKLNAALGVKGRTAMIVACGYSVALYFVSWEPIRAIPLVVIAGLLSMLGISFLKKWMWEPQLGREKYLVPLYVGLNEWLGPLSGLGILGGLGVVTFVWR